jgi:hypothetical protein
MEKISGQQSQSQSHFTADGQSASQSWCRAPSGTHDQMGQQNGMSLSNIRTEEADKSCSSDDRLQTTKKSSHPQTSKQTGFRKTMNEMESVYWG